MQENNEAEAMNASDNSLEHVGFVVPKGCALPKPKDHPQPNSKKRGKH